ncbi:GNAT family N-acetyltransferase [Thalassolituus sp. LLYu03]|uniref:GNAT family N-acetyltransferase n=1 Tax=Thalassolituus sp. LLYu03 TaxID=3421656 RepID=UPI003D2E687F
MQLRPAVLSDVPALSELVRSLAHFYLTDSTQTLPFWFADTLTPDAFSARLQSADYRTLVAAGQNGDLLGYITLKQPAHLYHLFVREDQHGRGIARALWQQLQQQTPAVTPFTLRSSLFAVSVYQALGFVCDGDAGHKDGIGFQPMVLHTAKPA